MTNRAVPHPTLFRLGLIALGLSQLTNGVYALFDPRGFYNDFPVGRGWVEAIPAYNPHLTTDVGALFIATGVLMLVAAMRLHRPLVWTALATWLLFAVPHTVYHEFNLGPYGTGDAIGQTVVLALTVTVPVALLILLSRPPRRIAAASPDTARIPLVERPRGLIARGAFASSKRDTGAVMDPVRAFAHSPAFLAGYGALELAAQQANRLEPRIKELAVMRAAALSGCEWCLDFGSATAHEHGVTEDDLRALPTYPESGRFTEAERLALDYASGMTRTPVDVSDELVAELREHFDDPQLVELTAIVALENLRARFNWALGLGSQGYAEGGYCMVPVATPAVSVGSGG